MLPFGRIRCGPVDTPDSVNRPSLSTRALACGPNAVWSVVGAPMRTCVISGTAPGPGWNELCR